jgi:hypothetical protein
MNMQATPKTAEDMSQLTSSLALDALRTSGHPDTLPTAAETVARLCASMHIPQYRDLAARLLSYWASEDAPQVAEVAKELVRRLKLTIPERLPEIFLEAMKVCFLRCLETDAAAYDEENEAHEYGEDYDPLVPFLALSERIASSQTVSSVVAQQVIKHLTVEGVRWALSGEEAETRAEFLQGACYFAVKLKGAAAADALAAVEAAGEAVGLHAALSTDDVDENDPWLVYHLYVDKLRQQAHKAGGRPKSTLKQPGGGPGASAAVPTKASGRKISFAPVGDSNQVIYGDGEDHEEGTLNITQGPQQQKQGASHELQGEPTVMGNASMEGATSARRTTGTSKQRSQPKASRFAEEAAARRAAGAFGQGGGEEGMVDIMPTEEELPHGREFDEEEEEQEDGEDEFEEASSEEDEEENEEEGPRRLARLRRR